MDTPWELWIRSHLIWKKFLKIQTCRSIPASLQVNPILGWSVDTKLFSIIVDTRLVGAWWCTWIDHWRLHGSQNWTKKHTSFKQYLHIDWDTLSGKFNLQFDLVLKRPRIACRLFETVDFSQENQLKRHYILISKPYDNDYGSDFLLVH